MESAHLLLKDEGLWLSCEGSRRPLPTLAPLGMSMREMRLCRLAMDISGTEVERVTCETIFVARHVICLHVEIKIQARTGEIRRLVEVDGDEVMRKTADRKWILSGDQTVYFFILSAPSLNRTHLRGTFLKVECKGVMPSTRGSYDDIEKKWKRVTETGKDLQAYTDMVTCALTGSHYLPPEEGTRTLRAQLLTRSAFF